MKPRAGGQFAERFRLERKVGGGSGSAVWSAFDAHTQAQCALKYLAPSIVDDAEASARFALEERIAHHLQGPYFPRLIHSGRWHDYRYIAWRWHEGESLRDLLDRTPRQDAPSVHALVQETCKALGQVHRAGYVHGNVKPENLFFELRPETTQRQLRLFGFKIASSPGAEHPADSFGDPGRVVGSPLYMSPEQAQGLAPLSPKSDLWSLGVVVFEALTGRVPFWGRNLAEVLTAIQLRNCPQPSSIAEVPGPFDGFWNEVMEERFEDTASFALGLGRALAPALRLSHTQRSALAPLAPAARTARAASPEPPAAQRAHEEQLEQRTPVTVSPGLAASAPSVGADQLAFSAVPAAPGRLDQAWKSQTLLGIQPGGDAEAQSQLAEELRAAVRNVRAEVQPARANGRAASESKQAATVSSEHVAEPGSRKTDPGVSPEAPVPLTQRPSRSTQRFPEPPRGIDAEELYGRDLGVDVDIDVAAEIRAVIGKSRDTVRQRVASPRPPSGRAGNFERGGAAISKRAQSSSNRNQLIAAVVVCTVAALSLALYGGGSKLPHTGSLGSSTSSLRNSPSGYPNTGIVGAEPAAAGLRPGSSPEVTKVLPLRGLNPEPGAAVPAAAANPTGVAGATRPFEPVLPAGGPATTGNVALPAAVPSVPPPAPPVRATGALPPVRPVPSALGTPDLAPSALGTPDLMPPSPRLNRPPLRATGGAATQPLPRTTGGAATQPLPRTTGGVAPLPRSTAPSASNPNPRPKVDDEFGI